MSKKSKQLVKAIWETNQIPEFSAVNDMLVLNPFTDDLLRCVLINIYQDRLYVNALYLPLYVPHNHFYLIFSKELNCFYELSDATSYQLKDSDVPSILKLIKEKAVPYLTKATDCKSFAKTGWKTRENKDVNDFSLFSMICTFAKAGLLNKAYRHIHYLKFHRWWYRTANDELKEPIERLKTALKNPSQLNALWQEWSALTIKELKLSGVEKLREGNL
ncbi:hypothetical protein KA183_13755 [bacterium]|nr:hypothetical protein [bacterium]